MALAIFGPRNNSPLFTLKTAFLRVTLVVLIVAALAPIITVSAQSEKLPIGKVKSNEQIAHQAQIISEQKEQKIRDLLASGRGKLVVDNHLKQILQQIRHERFQRCLKVLGSPAVCNRSVAFYLWAQKMAGEMMAGEY